MAPSLRDVIQVWPHGYNREMSPSRKTPIQHQLLPDWGVWCVTEQNFVQLSNLLSMNGPGMNAADKIYIQLIQFPLPLVYVTVGIWMITALICRCCNLWPVSVPGSSCLRWITGRHEISVMYMLVVPWLKVTSLECSMSLIPLWKPRWSRRICNSRGDY